MKDKEKSVGTNAQTKPVKERERRQLKAICLAVILLITIISAYFAYTFLNQPQNQTINPPYELKAAIVDHLSLTAPNQTFTETATNILEQAGYIVDYYPGEEVTVEFYRNLSAHGYRIVILRVHSALGKAGQPPVALFTSEPYSEYKYVSEQWAGDLMGVAFSEEWEEGKIYFGIMPSFVKWRTNGRFENTTIIMMGCDGLTYTVMARAFIGKGAGIYIGWNDMVSASRTDQSTTHLLKYLLIENQTINQAVENTMKKVGSDPGYNSLLTYYPLEAGNQTIEDIKNNH